MKILKNNGLLRVHHSHTSILKHSTIIPSIITNIYCDKYFHNQSNKDDI